MAIVLITVIIFAYYSLYASKGWEAIAYGLFVGVFVNASVYLFFLACSKIKENPGWFCGWTISFIGYCVFLHFKYKDSHYPDSLEDYFYLTFAYSMVTMISSVIGGRVKNYKKFRDK